MPYFIARFENAPASLIFPRRSCRPFCFCAGQPGLEEQAALRLPELDRVAQFPLQALAHVVSHAAVRLEKWVHERRLAQLPCRLARPFRHGPQHELIKKRNGKSRVPMRRAVDHSFFDQAGAQRCNGLHFDAEPFCNLS